jgi:hypothetical protein
MPLDLIGLEESSLERARHHIDGDRTRLRQHLQRPLGHPILLAKIAIDPMTQRGRLADIQDVATRPKHAVDTWRIRH